MYKTCVCMVLEVLYVCTYTDTYIYIYHMTDHMYIYVWLELTVYLQVFRHGAAA